jgi:hypothetical protein
MVDRMPVAAQVVGAGGAVEHLLAEARSPGASGPGRAAGRRGRRCRRRCAR